MGHRALGHTQIVHLALLLRAAFLRYVAASCTIEQAKSCFETWERIMGEGTPYVNHRNMRGRYEKYVRSEKAQQGANKAYYERIRRQWTALIEKVGEIKREYQPGEPMPTYDTSHIERVCAPDKRAKQLKAYLNTLWRYFYAQLARVYQQDHMAKDRH